MNTQTAQTAQPKDKKTQVIGCRVSIPDWDRFEQRCFETGVTMSQVLQDAVSNYIRNN
jgi:hypothetical protein